MIRQVEYCSTCHRIPLIYESEYDLGICEECQDRAIAKYQRMREWAEYHEGEWYDEQEGRS